MTKTADTPPSPQPTEAEDMERAVALDTNKPIVTQWSSDDYKKGYDTGYHAGIRANVTAQLQALKQAVRAKHHTMEAAKKTHSDLGATHTIGYNSALEEVETLIDTYIARIGGEK